MKVQISSVVLFVICFASYASCRIDTVTIVEDNGEDKPAVSPAATQCGGPGDFTELRWSGCEDTVDDLCQISSTKDSELSVMIGYVPVANLHALSMRVTTTIEGRRPIVEWDGTIPDSAVEPGKTYSITVVMADVMIPVEWRGKTVEAQYEILDDVTGQVRICVKDKVVIGV